MSEANSHPEARLSAALTRRPVELGSTHSQHERQPVRFSRRLPGAAWPDESLGALPHVGCRGPSAICVEHRADVLVGGKRLPSWRIGAHPLFPVVLVLRGRLHRFDGPLRALVGSLSTPPGVPAKMAFRPFQPDWQAPRRSPSPQPSPAGRGGQFNRHRVFRTRPLIRARLSILPLPAGEGRGEGEGVLEPIAHSRSKRERSDDQWGAHASRVPASASRRSPRPTDIPPSADERTDGVTRSRPGRPRRHAGRVRSPLNRVVASESVGSSLPASLIA